MLEYWIWLSERKGLNGRQKLALAERFPDLAQLWQTDPSLLEGLKPAAVESLADKDLSSARKILDACVTKGIRILTVLDKQYPNRLRSIQDPPTILYYYGTVPDFDRLAAIGVVGTRKASAYGLMAARKLSAQLTAHGGLVVSGMAAGIDAQASLGALDAGGSTVCVLGCGVDHIYPAENRELYHRVLRDGCVLSEYPPGTRPAKWNFPRRNRIISGLSCGVLVVEAPENSGTMITARDARSQGRDLFVVPANIDSPYSYGSNALLQDGAKPVFSGWDVLTEYEALFPDTLSKAARPIPEMAVQPVAPKPPIEAPAPKVQAPPPPAPTPKEDAAVACNDKEKTLLSLLSEGELQMDQLIARSHLGASAVLASVTMLELRGLVTVLPGNRVIRNS